MILCSNLDSETVLEWSCVLLRQVAVVVGGMAPQKQERVLKKGPEIVVATPGRLWELIQDGNPHLLQVDDIRNMDSGQEDGEKDRGSGHEICKEYDRVYKEGKNYKEKVQIDCLAEIIEEARMRCQLWVLWCRYLVIDETDRMLERGHFQELQQLLERLNTDPEKKRRRQNFVFSATLTLVHEPPRHVVRKKGGKKPTRITPGQKLGALIETLGITNPKVVDVTNTTGTAELLSEACIHCDLEEKDIYLYYFLQKHAGRTLVFCNSIGCVRRLAHLMGLLGCRPLPLHANMIQRQRLKNLDRFRSSPDGLLLATDVAARGLDIPGVEHVVHYQVPRTSEGYVHRSGRTARAQHAGITILLIEPSEVPLYARLCRTLGRDQQLPQFPIAEGYMAAVKERVLLARDLDRLELSSRRSSAAAGWLQKAAREMDILLDDDDDDVYPFLTGRCYEVNRPCNDGSGSRRAAARPSSCSDRPSATQLEDLRTRGSRQCIRCHPDKG
ncbi:hypothetical protein PR048_029672 [Dryococelus australis]|uniref:Uncharacterized protein n=1 Tax=Dryococelus australis TaxID=614101 RepID=A0ABQ9GE11_9NEOP|nr:hypothetical protein PR048_029672 [Dryococelus australis]